MTANELPYFKFVSALIDSGLWAIMSPAARALYPVLLRFSDRHFKPVYPGTRTLLKLTGFKQKSSLRKARNELVELGLVSVTTGTGRRNTCYHFRFDCIPQGDLRATLRGSSPQPAEEQAPPPTAPSAARPGGSDDPSRYNQIHISINNHVQDGPTGESEGAPRSTQSRVDGAEQGGGSAAERIAFLERRFGQRALELARSECELAGLEATPELLEKILYREPVKPQVSWAEMESMLARKISPGSLDLIRAAFIGERDGLLIFADALPDHLRILLERASGRVFFEPQSALASAPGSDRRSFWNSAGGAL